MLAMLLVQILLTVRWPGGAQGHCFTVYRLLSFAHAVFEIVLLLASRLLSIVMGRPMVPLNEKLGNQKRCMSEL